MRVKPELIDKMSGKRFRIYKNPTFIGRHRTCEICLPIVEVSRRHCKITEEDGEYFIEDNRSVNGTFLNEEPVCGRTRLEDGHHIKLAKCTKFPAGAKNFVFRHPRPKKVVSVAEGEGGISGERIPKKKIPLKDCTFHISKKSVLGGESKVRVPIQRLNGKAIHFLSLLPYRPGEVFSFSIEHPRLEPKIQLACRVSRVLSVKGMDVPVYRVETQVTKFGEKDRERYRRAIESTQLMRYGFLSLHKVSSGSTSTSGDES